VAVAIRPDEDKPVVLDDEKRGDTSHIEKEDAQSETSGVMSVSDVESTFVELDDAKCVHAPEGPSPSHVYEPDFWPARPAPNTWQGPSSSRMSLSPRKPQLSVSHGRNLTIARIGFGRPCGTCTRTTLSFLHVGTLSLEGIRKVHFRCPSHHRNPSIDWRLR